MPEITLDLKNVVKSQSDYDDLENDAILDCIAKFQQWLDACPVYYKRESSVLKLDENNAKAKYPCEIHNITFSLPSPREKSYEVQWSLETNGTYEIVAESAEDAEEQFNDQRGEMLNDASWDMECDIDVKDVIECQ